MAHPKRRISRSRAGHRQAHHALKAVQLVKCANCNADKQPHTICGECGYYGKDKKILEKSG